MSDNTDSQPRPLHKRYKRELIIAFVACALVGGALAVGFWPQVKVLMQQTGAFLADFVETIGAAGSGWFFAAYGIGPAIGMPISLFNITAGLVFVPKLGIFWTSLFAALSLMCANAISYWLARYAMRPVIERLIKKLGYKLPVIPSDEHITACLFLRVVPGPPYVIQSYILGLAKVRFLPYMVVSFLGQYGWAFAMIFLGKNFDTFKESGSFKGIFVAVVFIALLIVATRVVRRRITKKTAMKSDKSAGAGEGGSHE
ncbi:putative membrane protein YdjX (TVP38/TMEM64 family) [Ereboglobus sp. PH5-5]|uniref:TVP38/TMEM64 family protein n=1 Tax=Ereboglobus sp. PH5-5 TaxID=2940529 RepID=UPI0024060627|nr:VTT domain-containing protein [Ereboglobus sp. PH5-5]MDF9832609.1 putative membrane protein YdjX (TVP38/TMEM64 family) [Ereboglobus sp. PH5-5]